MWVGYSIWGHLHSFLHDKNRGIIHYNRHDTIYNYDGSSTCYPGTEGMVRNGAGQHRTSRFRYGVCTLPYLNLAFVDASYGMLSISLVLLEPGHSHNCMTRGVEICEEG